MHYYNEYDKNAAAWLRELIARKLIPAGEVDERSIVDVRPGDLKGFTQCHFFAGIGGWSRALQLAGWPEDKPVWTMSCPCQPFSTAGQGAGTADERHLWPVAFELVRQCRPPVVFGEQVASALVVGSVKRPVRKDGQNPPEEAPVWLDGVFVDLESAHYACGAAVVAAASVGAPHIRQRLYWVAYDQGQGREGVESQRTAGKLIGARVGSGGADGGMGDTRYLRGRDRAEPDGQKFDEAPRPSIGMDNSECPRLERHGFPGSTDPGDGWGQRVCQSPKTSGNNFWSRYELVPCRDGKARRIEPGSQPLVDGLPRGMVPVGSPSVQDAQATGEARVARLKGYGNAIVPQVAAQFILAAEEAWHDRTGELLGVKP